MVEQPVDIRDIAVLNPGIEDPEGRAIKWDDYICTQQQFITLKHDENTTLWTYRYQAVDTNKDQPPKGVIVFFHGSDSNCKFHGFLGYEFNKYGYDFVGYDYCGLGKSQGTRGLIESQESFYKDGYEFVKKVREFYQAQYPGYNIPLIAFGYSLGGMAAIGTSRLLFEHKEQDFDGYILAAPAIKALMISSLPDSVKEEIEKRAIDPKNDIEDIKAEIFKNVSLEHPQIFMKYLDPDYHVAPWYARTVSVWKEISAEDYAHFKNMKSPALLTIATKDVAVDNNSNKDFYNIVKEFNSKSKWMEYDYDHPLLNDNTTYRSIVKDQVDWLQTL